MAHKRWVLFFLGLGLLASAFSLAGYNLWESRQAGQASHRILEELTVPAPGTASVPAQLPDPDEPMPEISVHGKLYIGILEIPVLDLRLPILSECNLENLRLCPCRYQGSAYQDNLILAGHNYSSHFAPLAQLHSGDSVLFTDAKGRRFCYTVSKTEELAETALDEMEAGSWDLTLFTCTFSGKSRWTVRCERCD